MPQFDYVLGSGLSGLIAGRLLDIPVIGEHIGGQIASPFPLGPRILEDTDSTRAFLENLGVEAEPQEFKIGYYTNQGILDTAPIGFKESYYLKTRGEYRPTDSCMSGNKKVIKGWDLETIDLLTVLNRGIDLIPDKVLNIDTNNKRIDLFSGRSLKYRRIINTIPANIFSDIVVPRLEGFKFNSINTVFVLAHVSPSSEIDLWGRHSEYDYVYIAEEGIPFHRVTRNNSMTGTVIIELRGNLYPVELSGYGLQELSRHTVKNCQLLNNHDLGTVYDVLMLGRYAQWNHGVKIENVIDRINTLINDIKEA